MRKRLRRPSPALILAFIAVFLLGAGGATATSHIINGKNIKKGSVRYSALNKKAKKKLRGRKGPAGPQGPVGPAGSQGPKGDPGTPATRLWGVVNAGGTLVRNSGISGVSKGDGAESQGVYDVTFSQNVDGCAILTSIGQTGTAPAGIAGFISTRMLSSSVVRVETANVQNNPTNYPFHIAAFCP